LKLFDIFQNDYFEKYPEKWMKIQEGIEQKNRELEQEVMEYKEKKLQELEMKEKETSTDEQLKENLVENEISEMNDEEDL